MPSDLSATSQNGIAAMAKAVTAGISSHSGRAVVANASATPGAEPNVPGANGATSPIPKPVATKRQSLSRKFLFVFIFGCILYQIFDIIYGNSENQS